MKSIKIFIIFSILIIFIISILSFTNKYYENKFKIATAILIENLRKNEKELTSDIAKKDNYSICIDLLNNSSNGVFNPEIICKE